MRPVLMPVHETAACLRVSVRTVRRWIAEGDLDLIDGRYVDQVQAEYVRDAKLSRRATTQFTTTRQPGRGGVLDK